MKSRRTAIFVVAILLFVLLVSSQMLAGLITDWYWFQHLHFATVFKTEVLTQLFLAVGVGLVAFGCFYVNLVVAQRGVVPDPVVVRLQSGGGLELTRLFRRIAWLIALFFAFVVGLTATQSWLDVLRFLHRTPFGRVDPVFGRDIGYYFFTLPVVSLGLGLIVVLVTVALLMVIPLYVLRRDVVILRRHVTIEPSAEVHLGVLVAVLLAAAGARAFWVRLPSLLYSTTGPLFGASYTDLTVSAPVLRVLGVIAFLGAAWVLYGAWTRRLVRNMVMAVGMYVGVAIIGAVGAGALQKFVVVPNELVRETPQLEHHIVATRHAWGLDHVTVRDLSGEATLSKKDIEANAGTIRNVRLWDREPLLQTFQQLQEIRTYYDFRSVDDDRYWIDGQYRQVLLSARELNTASLPQQNFINEHLTYTHGMGLTLSPVNEVSQEGLPVLFVKDLPPTSTVGLNVNRPGLYYSELANDYALVDTHQREFDYPLADTSAFTEYHGLGGIPVHSFFRRLLMSVRFGSLDILFTDLTTPKSRILFHRNIRDRASTALPFLLWDSDPYLVITGDGHLVWMLDAYTASKRYPYSEPVQGGTNYLRNSVKVVIDAYDGTVRAYVADPSDPLIQTYEKIFPGIFLPIDSMPESIRPHVRYPTDLFRIQTALYTTYHMDTPSVFYAREDQWQIPMLPQGGTARDPFLRHMVMRLPDEKTEEYISMTPFTPRGKDNLAAWMVARSDRPNYGQLIVYRFPRQSLIFGPSQIENRINQNTDISRQISLWDQRGSRVIRGNLLVIPIGESLIFVQALYLQAEGGSIPELKRVIVAYQNQVVMDTTLGQALGRLFGGAAAGEAQAGPPVQAAAAAAAAAPGAVPGAATPSQIRNLVRQTSRHYEAAIAAQQRGDWATYGEEMRAVQDGLARLRQLVGGGSSQ